MTTQELNYRQLVTLSDGARVLLRLLTPADRQALTDLYAPIAADDMRYLRHNVRDPKVIEAWVEGLDYDRVMPLLGLAGDRVVGNCTLHFGHGPTRHIAEVRIFLARDFRRRGLGSRMLHTLLELARRRSVFYLLAQIVSDQTNEIKAFEQAGFERKCTLDSFFMLPDGDLRDVVQLVYQVRAAQNEF